MPEGYKNKDIKIVYIVYILKNYTTQYLFNNKMWRRRFWTMVYKENVFTPSVLDGEISEDKAIIIVSDLTNIELSVLKKGLINYSFVMIMEDPSVLEITEEQKEQLISLKKLIDFGTGVRYEWF